MLRRRSIRTKLIIALTLLSAIVVLLAGSGFGGLRGYQDVTQALIMRAEEQRLAQELMQTNDALETTNLRILRLLENEPMIGSSTAAIQRQRELERGFLGDLVSQFRRTLDRYSQLRSTANDSSLEAIWGEETFVKMQSAFEDLSSDHLHATSVVTREHSRLSHSITRLSEATDEHLTFIQQDMQQLAADLGDHHHAWWTVSLFCTAAALSMVGLLLWCMNSLVVKPFRTLLDGSRLVAGGQFDHRIDLGTDDELSELAIAMNEMTDRFQGAYNKLTLWCTDLDRQVRERTREVIQNEQLASVGFLAAGVAHEINNPLATIAWSAESLESRVDEMTRLPDNQRVIDSEFSQCLTDNLRRIEEEAFRCKGITEKLLDFSRLREVQRVPTNLIDLVKDVVEMVSKVGKYRCKTIHVGGAEEVVADVNPQEIRQVVLNLVTNALESVDTEGVVDIAVECDQTNALIAISDNGCGMTDDVLQHIFEPFFTRRRDGTGTGLGLSITYRIVSQHGGSLTAHSEGEGRGSRMEIQLPIAADATDQGERPFQFGPIYEPFKTA